MPPQLVVVSSLQNCLNVSLSACYRLLVLLKLSLVLPLCFDADLGELDTHWLTHQGRRREVVLIAGADIGLRRLSEVVELILGLVLGDESVSREKFIVARRVLEHAALYI